jgi:glycosyltransferase involved in cell wall biosynthesis
VRVGIDARYAFRRGRRGIGNYVAELLAHLGAVAAPEDRFVLYVDGPAVLDAVALPDPRFAVRRLPVANPLLFEEVALARAAREDRVDLLHLTANYGPSRPPCPTVYTVHDLIEWVRPTLHGGRLPLRHALGRAVRLRTLPPQLRRARAVLTVSEASRRDLVRILGLEPARVRVVPLGVSADLRPAEDPAAVRAALRAAGYAVPERYVLALGALDPRKNGPRLLRAFARVQARFPDVALWIVGVERLDRYPIPFRERPGWLTVLGFVPREVLVRLLQGATAFAYPSLYEGFGLPVLEAMALGVPVLAADRTSVPEVAGDAALLVDPTDEAALALGLARLLADADLRAELAARGLRRAARFSWAQVARATRAAYAEALGAAP